MKARQGFTLVEISVTVSVLGLLAALAIPTFSAARRNSLENNKKANVRVFSSAVEMWAMDNVLADDSLVGLGITNYLKGGLQSLNVGQSRVNVSNVMQYTVCHNFTVGDLYPTDGS